MNGRASWTFDKVANTNAWYIALEERGAAPYRQQRVVEAILDFDEDGRLAGVELTDRMPLPPKSVWKDDK